MRGGATLVCETLNIAVQHRLQQHSAANTVPHPQWKAALRSKTSDAAAAPPRGARQGLVKVMMSHHLPLGAQSTWMSRAAALADAAAAAAGAQRCREVVDGACCLLRFYMLRCARAQCNQVALYRPDPT